MGKLLTLAALLGMASAASKSEWKNNKAVYQLLTDRFYHTDANGSCSNLGNYCGGNFKGIIEKMDYIKNLGFDAIWISPVVDNTDGGYHGYWARDWNKINDHFGSEQDLKDLVNAAHSKGLWVMVDVVANHVGPVGNDFSSINPYNKAEHYHSNCDINWSDQHSVEYCRLAGLPDLNQENSWVADQLKSWIHNLVQTYNLDGIRIDTIPEVPKSFWSEYTASAGVFPMGECFNGDPNFVGDYQNHVEGLFNYPMFYTIRDVFQNSKSMYGIRNRYNQESGPFNDIDALGLFVDNHDNARFLHGNDNKQGFHAALIFSLTGRGIPFFYYGSEQDYGGGNDPQNREQLWTNMNEDYSTYKLIQTTNRVRHEHNIGSQEYIERYVDDNFYAYSRGDALIALTNSGNQVDIDVTYLPYKEGQTVCNVFYSSDCAKVENGSLHVTLKGGESKIYVPAGSAMLQAEAEKTFLQE